MKTIIIFLFFSSVNLFSQTLVGYWPFSGNTDDLSGRGNNGVIYGDVTLTTDRCGNSNSAYRFNGGWINTGNNGFPSGSGERTFCVWFKKDPGYLNDDNINLFGYGSNDFNGCRNYIFMSPHRNELGIECRNTYKSFSWNAADTNWHFVCAVFNPGSAVTTNYQLYYDGLLVSNVIEYSPYTSINTNTQAPTIGCLLGGVLSIYKFYGKIDDVRLYSSALNAQQIWDLYNYNCFPCETTVDAGPDAEIFLGYGSQSMTLNASPSGGTEPYQYLWTPGGATTQSFTVSPTATTTYTVQVTDAHSCTASDEVVVNVYDTRCGNNGNKILVCHNGVTICISQDALEAHLGHGDKLDSCERSSDNLSGTENQPLDYSLAQNYPNPFNPSTAIKFSLPKSTFVKLTVYDVSGREVQTLVNNYLNSGTYSVNFDGSKLSSGVYYYKIDGLAEVKKMVLIK